MEDEKYVDVKVYRKDTDEIKDSIDSLSNKVEEIDRRHTERHHKNERDMTRIMVKFEGLPDTLKELNSTMKEASIESRKQAERLYTIEVEQLSQKDVINLHSEKLQVVDDLEKKKERDNRAIIIQVIITVGTITAAALGASHLWL